jgi:transcriptional regulator GlxA family with amidase domain
MRTSSEIVAVLLFDEHELLDVAGPVQALTMAGRKWNFRPFKIVPVAARPGLVETRSQLRLEATKALAEVPAPEVILVPGGYGARKAASDDLVVSWLRSAGASATSLLAVGNGVLLLASAGLLDGGDVAASAELAELVLDVSPTTRVDAEARWKEWGKVKTAATALGAVEAALDTVSKRLGKKQAAQVAREMGVPWAESAAGDVAIIESG